MGDVGGEPSTWHRRQAFAAAVADRCVRRIVLSVIGFSIVETITWTGSLVYAYRQGGAGAVGVVGFALLIPSVIVAPLASFAGDRYHRVRVLIVSHSLIAAFCVAAALLIGLDAGRAPVYAALALLATVVTFPRPGVGALLPCTVGSGDQLTAANVAIGFAQSAAQMLGPVLAAILLAAGRVELLFWVASGAGAASALAVAGVELRRDPLTEEERMSLGDVHEQTTAGLKLLRRERVPRVILGVLGLQAAMVGVLDVAAVVVALDVIRRPEQFAGWLSAATGVGAVLGSLLALLLIGRRRTAPGLIVSTMLCAGPMLILLGPAGVGSAVLMFGLCGIGLAVCEIAGQTMLQRVTPDEVMARVYGILEGFRMGSIAVGSLVCSLLFDRLSAGSVGVVIAAGLGVLIAAAAPILLNVDRDRVPPDPALLDVLRATHFLAPLPAHALERVCRDVVRVEPRPGHRIIEYGMPGTAMFIVAAGTVRIERDGVHIRECGPCDHFGELALIDGTARNADAIAGDGVVLYQLEQSTFQMATTGFVRAAQRMGRIADQRRS